MKRRKLVMLSVALWLQATGLAMAASPPAKVVEQFIEAHLQGQFAAAHSLTVERVNLSASLFSNWFFGPASVGDDAATADLFLSRKFAQTFRYTITGTTPTGDNQVAVAAWGGPGRDASAGGVALFALRSARVAASDQRLSLRQMYSRLCRSCRSRALTHRSDRGAGAPDRSRCARRAGADACRGPRRAVAGHGD